MSRGSWSYSGQDVINSYHCQDSQQPDVCMGHHDGRGGGPVVLCLDHRCHARCILVCASLGVVIMPLRGPQSTATSIASSATVPPVRTGGPRGTQPGTD